MTTTSTSRGMWGSRLGFVLAASGSAIGLGNIWKFPIETGQNGGAAFVFVYLICVFGIGIPVIFDTGVGFAGFLSTLCSGAGFRQVIIDDGPCSGA